MPRRQAIIGIVAVILAVAIDRTVFAHVQYDRVYEQDWGRMLRIVGFWPTWIVAALAMWLTEDGMRADARRRAALLVASPALSALATEIAKLLIRRERPVPHDGHSVFRSFAEHPFSTSGLATPSSHVAVAIGAAAILARLYPRARWVWYGLAAGCAFSRLLARAHFTSDVVAATLLGLATTSWLWRRFGRHSAAS